MSLLLLLVGGGQAATGTFCDYDYAADTYDNAADTYDCGAVSATETGGIRPRRPAPTLRIETDEDDELIVLVAVMRHRFRI